MNLVRTNIWHLHIEYSDLWTSLLLHLSCLGLKYSSAVCYSFNSRSFTSFLRILLCLSYSDAVSSGVFTVPTPYSSFVSVRLLTSCILRRIAILGLPLSRSANFFCCCFLLLFSRVPLLRPHELWPTRLLCPWHSPGKRTAVSCHFLLQGIFLTQRLILSLLGRSILYYWATWEASLF